MKRGTFMKLRSGDWGVRITGNAKRGDRVEITKTDGAVVEAIVGCVFFSDGVVSLAELQGGSVGAGANVCAAGRKP